MIAILFASLAPAPALAETPVEGVVRIRGTRDPVPQVNVVLLPSRQRTTTDDEGRFRFEPVPDGEATLIVNAPGYKRFEKIITLAPAGVPERILLEPDATTAFETTIQASGDRDSVQKTISKKTAESLPGAGADPVRAIQNLPGVNRSQGFTSQVIIQGSAPQDTRYTIDGHEIPLIFHFGGLSSVFNPELTGSFDFLSAGYQSNYSRALGGVLNLNSKNLSSRQFKGSAFVDTFNSGAAIETPVGERGQLAAGARISYVGQVLKAVLKGNENFALTVAPTYGDLGLIYQRPLSPNLNFKLVSIGSRDSLEFVAANALGNDPSLRGNFSNEIGFFRFIPQFEWTHSNHSKTKLSMAVGRDFINTDIGDSFFNLRTLTSTVRAENRTRVNDQLTLAYGMDHRFTLADVSFRIPVITSDGGVINPLSSGETRTADLRGVFSDLYGFYFNPVFRPATDSKWTFFPGLRIDYFGPVDDLQIGPRLGTRYAATPDLTLVAAGGLYGQPPEERQSSASYGNPAVKGSQVWQLKLGAEKDLSNEIGRGSEAYSGFFGRWFQNLIIPDTSRLFVNEGSGRALGWENSFQTVLDNWNFWAIYTLSRSTRWDPRRPEYLYQYDQTHFLTLIAGVNLKRNWRISTRFRYVTGPLETVPQSAAGDLDNDVFIPIRGALFNERLDPFAMLDLRIDKRWVYDSWTLSLYLDILNVLNRQNVEGLQYSYDYTRSEPVRGFPVLPTFGLKGEF